MSKSKKENKDITKILENINDDLEKLEKSTNLNDILKKHKNIKDKIEQSNNLIINLKSKFESFIYNKTELTDDDFSKSMDKLNIMNDDSINDMALELQVEKYIELSNIINNCKGYLESKKIEIIKCE